MGKLFKSLSFGGIVGFFLGLLFAPSKGEETRKKLQDSIGKGKEKFEELKEEFKKEKENLD